MERKLRPWFSQQGRWVDAILVDTYSVVLNGNEAENRTERDDSMKILGMKIDQHLTWEEHISNDIKSSYDTLRSLKLLKRYTPYKLRKTLAETLILSKIDYGSVAYQNVPKIAICIESLRKRMWCNKTWVVTNYWEIWV